MQLVRGSHRITMALALGALLLLVAGCYASPLEEARKQVTTGTLRDDAIQILNEKAWYHQVCHHRIGTEFETIEDLFFFGSHKYDRADIIIVTSAPVNSVFVVNREIGSFDPYLWHSVYGDCIQRDRFEN